MHEFAQNRVCNARKLLAAGALPQTPLGSLRRSPKPPSRLGVGKPPAHASPPQSFRRLASSSWATSPNVPLPKQFSGFTPGPPKISVGWATMHLAPPIIGLYVHFNFVSKISLKANRALFIAVTASCGFFDELRVDRIFSGISTS